MTQINVTPTVSIRQKIATQLAELAPSVETRVVAELVEKETAKRAALIVRGLDKLTELQREHRKIERPDNVTYNADGSTASESYTKPRLEEIKKSGEQLVKVEKAINKALEGELSDLSNLVK